MGLLRKEVHAKGLTIAERLVTYAVKENSDIDSAVRVYEGMTSTEVSSRDIREAKESLFRIRENERKMRLNDNRWY